MSDIVIRKALQSEIPLLQDVQLDAGELFRSAGMDDVADHPPEDAAILADAINADMIWVACQPDGTPIGMAHVTDLDGVAYLQEIAMRASHGRRGTGASLLRAVMAELRGCGYRRMTLSTFSHLAWNRPFYEKLGFKVIPKAAWDDSFHDIRRGEVDAGLDIDMRVFMGVSL